MVFKNKIFKTVMSIVFGGIILFLYIFLTTHSTTTYRHLYYACIVLSFLLALLFLRPTLKNICLTAALFFACCADYCLILNFSVTNMPSDQIYGMLAFCALQVCFAVYTWFLLQRQSLRIAMLTARLLASLCVIIILPLIGLGLLEILSVIYILNFLITIVVTSCQARTEWLTLIGMISFFICDIFVGLNNGGSAILGLKNVAWLTAHDYSFYFYVPGIFIIALSSVWGNKKKAA